MNTQRLVNVFTSLLVTTIAVLLVASVGYASKTKESKEVGYV